MMKESSMLMGPVVHANHQHHNHSYFMSPRRWSVGWFHKPSWFQRRGWRPGIISFCPGAIFLRIIGTWKQVTDELSRSLLKIVLPSKISSSCSRKWVVGPSEFGPGLDSLLRMKWYSQWLVRGKVTLSSTATPFLPSAAVLWLPLSLCNK